MGDNMAIRRNASWQERLDERILEVLDDESWSTPSVMVLDVPIEATKAQIQDRCKVLADAGLIAIEPDDGWMIHLKTRGKLYLEGEVDIDLYPSPRSPRTLDEGPANWSRHLRPY